MITHLTLGFNDGKCWGGGGHYKNKKWERREGGGRVKTEEFLSTKDSVLYTLCISYLINAYNNLMN